MTRIDRGSHRRFTAGAFGGLITGASSGLGAALALKLARPGATLYLAGRDASRLEDVARRARERGAHVRSRQISVTDADAVRDWISGIGSLDLVIANAGISGGVDRHGIETLEQARSVFATNLDGALNTIVPAAEKMAAQTPDATGWRGRIAAIASIAAFLPTPIAPSYGASKAALHAWMTANASAWAKRGVLLSSVCPGFIRSPMTANNRFPMPGLMDADAAADLILTGLAASRPQIVFPRWMGAAARATGLLPAALQALLTGQGSKPTR